MHENVARQIDQAKLGMSMSLLFVEALKELIRGNTLLISFDTRRPYYYYITIYPKLVEMTYTG